MWKDAPCVKLVEVGCIMPPLGLDGVVVKGVVSDAAPLGTIFRGVL